MKACSVFRDDLSTENLRPVVLLAVVLVLLPEQLAYTDDFAPLALVAAHNDGVGADRRLNGEHSVTMSDDGRFVYAARDLERALLVYQRDARTGQLSLVQSFTNKYEGDKTLMNPELLDMFIGPRAVTMSPDNRHLYLVLHWIQTVLVFERDKEFGKLKLIQRIWDKDGSMGLAQPIALSISPDGQFVYVACMMNSAIVILRRDKANGSLSKVEVLQDKCITDMPGTALGKPITGAKITRGLNFVQALAMCSDGKHLYATSFGDHALSAFVCDSENGKLENVQTILDGDRLYRVCNVTVSGDGRFVYCSIRGKHGGLSVFGRDPKTGEVEFVEVHRNSINGVEGLRHVSTIALSPNADRVFCCDQNGSGISIFDRDKETGRLKFVAFVKNETDGIKGLNKVSDLVISPDGKHLYAASNEASAAVFEIRPAKMAR